ncbi:MAG: N-6 DNA methylase [Bacteroidaceae bacterium]|nr:N-6 DNA methylase [Bacteroidaceae bacterium]
MQYEQTFNAIDNILRNEAGCSTELDYIEQTSWLLFLKYLDDLEQEQAMNALLSGKTYKPIITGYMRWSQWAAPKKADGSPDTVNAMTGPDLTQFVDGKLFPTLREFQKTASSAKTLEYKIGEIFAELRNKITSGYNLREVINLIDQLHFQTAEDKHEMTLLYESKIAKMGNAGRNGGEYYTPRPLIRTIVRVVDPQIGETVYDPACGSAGFLCEAFTYMNQKVKSTADNKTLQEDTFFGKEKKPLPYIIATMNMIFHGVAAPNIIRGNTLAENLSQIQEKDRKNVILANPPFGGSERGEVKQNFDINTSETAYMFMQHFIKMLKTGGRAGIVIKNTFLSNGDASALRQLLLQQCNLHTILDLPSGVFQGAGVKTVVLFFDKGTPTKKIWYYQLNPGRNLGKTNALNEDDLADFLALQKTKADSENSWSIDVSSLGKDYDLSVKNPNKVEEVDERSSAEIVSSLLELQKESQSLLNEIKDARKLFHVELTECMKPQEGWEERKLGEVCEVISGQSPEGKYYNTDGQGTPFYQGKKEFSFKYIGEPTMWTTAETKIATKGDLLMSVRAPVGDVNFATQRLCIGRGLAAIRTKEEIDKEYLFYYLVGKKSCIKGKEGVGFASINRKEIMDIGIQYPEDLSAQHSIVSHLDSLSSTIRKLEELQQKTLAECDALKQAMLREVFE